MHSAVYHIPMTGTTLLQLAVALLIAAQQPNVPADLRNTAINLANLALQSSMEEPVQTPTKPQITPSLPLAPEPVTEVVHKLPTRAIWGMYDGVEYCGNGFEGPQRCSLGG